MYLETPLRVIVVGSFAHLSTDVRLGVVDKETDLFVVIVLDEVEEVVFSGHGIRPEDVVRVWLETSLGSWGVGVNFLRGNKEKLLSVKKEKRVCNMVHIKIQTKAKYSNKLSMSYSLKVANVTKNSYVILLV